MPPSLRLAAVLLFSSGCSFLVNPDAELLGGAEDAGATDASSADTGTGGCASDCNDGLVCTEDYCRDSVCVNEPSDPLCEAGQRCNPGVGCVPERCTRDEDCDDRNVCNGVERCMPEAGDERTGCTTGVPLECDDGVDCTEDSCDSTSGCVAEPIQASCDDMISCTVDVCRPDTGCEHTPDDRLCNDGFCFVGGICNPELGCQGGTDRDCNDNDLCTMDSCDPELMMCVYTPVDRDGDGFPAAEGLGPCEGGTDCDDRNFNIHPGAEELCNGDDDNCDGFVDEGCGGPDSCEHAEEIMLTDGRGEVRGSMEMFQDDHDPGCGADAGGRDAVYYFDVPGITPVDIEISTAGSSLDTVLAVARSCTGIEGRALACNDDMVPQSTRSSRIWLHRFRPQATELSRIFVLVDSFAANRLGDFVLEVEIRPASGDGCVSPLDISGGGTVLGFHGGISGSVGGLHGDCQTLADIAAPEAVFELNPTEARETFRASSPAFVPDIYVRSRCTSGESEIGCVTGSSLPGGGGSAEITVMYGNRSNHFVVVDDGIANSRYTLHYEPMR